MVKWLKNRKWVLTSLFLVAVLLSLSGVQVIDRTALDNRVGIGIGNEKVITLGHIAYAAGPVDYTYDGVDDDVQFQLALGALPATGGRIVDVSAVQKNFSATVTRAIPNVTIDGSGAGSYFVNDGITALFTAGGNNWKFENLRTDAGSINMGATTEWMWTNVTVNVTYYAYRSPYGQSAFNDTTVASLTDSGLTATRVPIAGVGGLLSDDADLTYDLATDILETPTGRGATLTVAAVDSDARSIAQADYICDGTADDVQIQAAHDALPASGGTILQLEGSYSFSTDVNISSNNVKVIGYGATITPSANSDYAFEITGDYDTLEGVTIDCNDAGNSFYYPVYINTASHTTITYCTITEVQTDPGGTYGVTIHIHSGVAYADINHNYIADGGIQTYGILSGHGAVANTQINVSNNFVKDVGYNGIGMYSDTTYFVIDSNIVESSGHNCISASAAHYGTISNNVAYDATNAGESGIEVETNAAHGAFHTYNISVVGNTIYNCYGGVILRDSGSIYDVYDIVISGNNIYDVADAFIKQTADVYRLTIVGNAGADAGAHGLSFEGLTHSTITGNTVSDVFNSGIILNACSHNIVNNNIIFDVNNSLTGNHGIRLLSTATYNVFEGNRVDDVAGNLAGEGYGYSEGAAVDDYNTIMGNTFTNTYETGINVQGLNDAAYDNSVDIFMDVLAVTATTVRSNEDLSAGVPITFTLDAQPDVPRTLSGHFDAHAQITAYSITVTGVTAMGLTQSEVLTEADGWDWETNRAFATVTSITMTARTGTGAGDTMDIGITDVLGLSNVIYETGDVYKIKKNAANAVAAGAQVNATYDTYDMAVIGLAATDDFTIWFRSNLNIIN